MSIGATSLQAQLPTLSSDLSAVRAPLASAVAAMGGSVEFTSELGVVSSVDSTLASVRGSLARGLDATTALPAQPLVLGSAKTVWVASGSGGAVGNMTQLQAALRGVSALAAEATRLGQTLTPSDWQAAVRLSLPRLAAALGSASSARASLTAPVTSAVAAAASLGPYAAQVLAIGCGDQMSDSVQAAAAAQSVFAAAGATQSRLAQLRSGLTTLSPLLGPLTTAVSIANSSAGAVSPLLITFSATWAALSAESISTLQDAATSLKELVAQVVDNFDSKVTGLMMEASQAVAT